MNAFDIYRLEKCLRELNDAERRRSRAHRAAKAKGEEGP